MRQTKKIISIAFLVSIVFMGYLYFIIQPQAYKKRVLQKNIKVCQLAKTKQEEILLLKNKIEEEYTEKNIEVTHLKKKFFEAIHQENIIVLLDKVISDSMVQVPSINFSELTKNDGIDFITVTLPFDGSYENLMVLLKRIREYSKKIIVNAINIDNMENNQLRGSIILDFYSLHNEDHEDEFFANFYGRERFRENPFDSFEEDIESYIPNDIEEISDSIENPSKKILYGFESTSPFFVGFPKKIIGKLYKDPESKEGQCAIKLIYDFIRPRKKSQGNVVLNEENIIIKDKVKGVGLWVYTSEKNNNKIVLVFIDQHGKNHPISLTNQIDWIGWRYLEGVIPQEAIYPIQLQRIYVESLDFDKNIKGILKFDQLEAVYDMKED
ncbi:MAG: GspMb/PilO family protein [Marinisporobacter sp.]|jgi:hypothetical protein|nr:GspMb/PilO family protein [Marinisporobacter sp.]